MRRNRLTASTRARYFQMLEDRRAAFRAQRNIARYRKLIAEAQRDLSRDET